VGRSVKDWWLDCGIAGFGVSFSGAGAMLVMSRNDSAAGRLPYRLSICRVLKRNCEIQQVI
jgi:hypothetical protein